LNIRRKVEYYIKTIILKIKSDVNILYKFDLDLIMVDFFQKI